MARQIRAAAAYAPQAAVLDPDEVLGRMAEARIRNPKPPLLWPALEVDEATRFGETLIERLSKAPLDRHIDVSCALVDGAPALFSDGTALAGGETALAGGGALAPGRTGAIVPHGGAAVPHDGATGDRRRIGGRRFDGLLAEETIWRGVEFTDCVVVGSSFAGGTFEGCEFRDCVFERTNLSGATLTGNTFRDCTFRDLQLVEPVWMECRLEGCTFERVAMIEPALRAVAFSGGGWREVQWTEGLLVELHLEGTDLDEVTFANTHAPHTRFERLSMFKVWALAKGFPGSVFEEVEATTCGFLGPCHFDETRFTRTRFVETGFTNAVFKDAHLTPGCAFDACDLTGAIFENTDCSGLRLLQCGLTMSRWSNAKAADAWFMGAMLRGVDFADTELARAVFTDADLEGAKFLPDKTIGADFRGASGVPA